MQMKLILKMTCFNVLKFMSHVAGDGSSRWRKISNLCRQNQYGARLAILHHVDVEDRGVMELWIMDDVKKNMWSRKTFLLDPSQMHLLNGIRLRVQGTTRNGEASS
ncbi:hypothetical protein Bca52824_028915 [Brassica carinata]|uniref:F-box associated beta-propeller type 3 domain-containing protein n=1 Tax=Brassica carinata TaxID=52824 RepID=A0A8X7VD07_BRACI|nr:hypothetical protein Bca52824_028915 [Brassica carinata]